MAGGRPRKAKPAVGGAADQGAVTVYESELWGMADALRGSMDASEYKHVVLGLIFLKYISDAFEERHAQLTAEQAEGADPEDPDEYRAENVFNCPFLRHRCVKGLRQPKLPPPGQRLPRFGGADPVTGKIEEQPADEAGADQELNTLQSLDRGCRRSSGGAGDQAETTSAAW